MKKTEEQKQLIRENKMIPLFWKASTRRSVKLWRPASLALIPAMHWRL
jgi:hypothetical protein